MKISGWLIPATLVETQSQFYKSPDGISFINWDSISAFSPTPISVTKMEVLNAYFQIS